MEEAAVGFEEGGEAGAGESRFLEDHGRGDLLASAENLGELGLDLLIGDLGKAAAGALTAGGSLCCLRAGRGSRDTESYEHPIKLLQLLGVLFVNGSDFLGDFLLNDGLGFQYLLGGFLLQGGELLDEIEGCFCLVHGGVMGF